MQCKICQKELKQITGTHLKIHNITVIEYKEKYGSVVSDEFRQSQSTRMSGENNPNFGHKMSNEAKRTISQKNKGKIPHNKGIAMSAKQKKILSDKAIKRNETWAKTNSHPLNGRVLSENTKEKIRKKRKEQIITKEQVQKAIQTKRDNGYDLAFFRGQTHSAETKKIISEKSKLSNKKKSDESITKSNQRLQEFGYTLVSVNDNIITVQCDTCNTEFSRTRQYSTASKITKIMCPTCYPRQCGISNAEKEVADFLKQYTTVIRNNRSIIHPKELDIFLPEHNIAIEYNGLYWHSEEFKDKRYHMDKTTDCKLKGMRLIHIFEDEWANKQNIVKSRLLSALGYNNRIFARKCQVKEISSREANKFISSNHIQGVGRANVHIGLYHESILMSVMTFLIGDISKKVEGWELNRFCNMLGYSIVGGASKLFTYFIRTYDPTQVVSFADIRWSSNDPFYTKLGFVQESITSPNYWYFMLNESKRYHRYGLRKTKNDNQQMTEIENRLLQGYKRIWDCGHYKFIYAK